MVKNYEATGFRAKEHRLSLVFALMSRPQLGLPLKYLPPPAISLAAHVFVGYLLLDALVGNTDRHHQNWGLIWVPNDRITLAPTFDHGSSLGRNEPDASRMRRLTTKDRHGDVAAYCERATSALYGPAGVLSTFDAFQEAGRPYPQAAEYWLGRLRDTTNADLRQIVSRVPGALISEPAVEFAVRMLEINRARLLGI
jgi:hypothetical protein